MDDVATTPFTVVVSTLPESVVVSELMIFATLLVIPFIIVVNIFAELVAILVSITDEVAVTPFTTELIILFEFDSKLLVLGFTTILVVETTPFMLVVRVFVLVENDVLLVVDDASKLLILDEANVPFESIVTIDLFELLFCNPVNFVLPEFVKFVPVALLNISPVKFADIAFKIVVNKEFVEVEFPELSEVKFMFSTQFDPSHLSDDDVAVPLAILPI